MITKAAATLENLQTECVNCPYEEVSESETCRPTNFNSSIQSLLHFLCSPLGKRDWAMTQVGRPFWAKPAF